MVVDVYIWSYNILGFSLPRNTTLTFIFFSHFKASSYHSSHFLVFTLESKLLSLKNINTVLRLSSRPSSRHHLKPIFESPGFSTCFSPFGKAVDISSSLLSTVWSKVLHSLFLPRICNILDYCSAGDKIHFLNSQGGSPYPPRWATQCPWLADAVIGLTDQNLNSTSESPSTQWHWRWGRFALFRGIISWPTRSL